MKNGIQFLSGLLFAAAAVGQTPTFSIFYTFPFTVNNTSTGNGYYPNGTMPNGRFSRLRTATSMARPCSAATTASAASLPRKEILFLNVRVRSFS